MTTEPIFDVAHLAHVELLTPKLEESVRFFIEVMGMIESGRKRRLGLPARLGRLRASHPAADCFRDLGHRPLCRARVQPAGAAKASGGP